MKLNVLIALIGILSIPHVQSLTVFHTINRPEACPDHLDIRVKTHSREPNLQTLRLSYEPHEPELYQGRQRVFAVLEIRNAEKDLQQRLSLEVNRKGKVHSASLSIAPELFAHAKLTLSTQLYEKDGHPTVGGGIIYEIPLTHFFKPSKTDAELSEEERK